MDYSKGVGSVKRKAVAVSSEALCRVSPGGMVLGLTSDTSVSQHEPLRVRMSKTVFIGVHVAALGGSQIPLLASDLARPEADVIAKDNRNGPTSSALLVTFKSSALVMGKK